MIGTGLGAFAGLAAAGFGGVELVAHGVLPGQGLLNQIDGACAVPSPPMIFSEPGPSISGTFYSRARRRDVGYTIAYPPGNRLGDQLPLIIALHAYGGDHTNALGSLGLAHGLAVHVDGRPLPPIAIAAADGGGGYWNPHPDDDPMRMVIGELIPRCQRMGLGVGRQEDRHHRHLDGRLRRAAACREVPADVRCGGSDQPGNLDELRAGQGGEARGVRLRQGVRLRRRGHARQFAAGRRGPGGDRAG